MRPTTAVPPPMLGAEYWTAAMERDGHCCHCTGACGRTHAKTAGRCDQTSRTQRLVAAPEQPTFDPIRDVGEQPRAWCETCLAGVKAAARKAERAIEPIGEPLFDLGPGDVVAKPLRRAAGAR